MPPTPRNEDPFDAPHFDPTEPAAEPLTPEQIEALTQALKDLTARMERQTPPGSPTAPPSQPTANVPWWIKDKPNYPGVPNFDPSFQPMDPGHRQWWARYTAGGPAGATAGGGAGGFQPPDAGGMAGASEPDPEDFSFVRSFWRRKARARAERRERERDRDRERGEPAAGGAGTIPPNKPPWWSRYTEPPDEGPPDPKGWFRWRNQKIPTAKDARVPWNRKRKRPPWHWKTTRKAGAWARQRFGRAAGRATVTGMGTAAGRLARGWSVQSAIRGGVISGAAAGGPMALAVVGLAYAAVKATEALNNMTREQQQYNRHLATASAQMARVVAEGDVQERMRNRERGDRLAGSARVLTQAEQFKEEQTKEIGILWEKSKNYAAAGWEDFKGALFFQLNQEAGFLNKIWEHLQGGGHDRVKYLTMDEWARDAQRLDTEARKRKDPKWDPPKH